MLTDLRHRLKGVGRLDVMAAVNENALQYYKDENLASLPVDSLERRARILHAMGEDDQERGDFDEALKKFVEAKRTTAALLAAAPNDPERIYDHAQSEYWVALISWRRQRLDAARAGFEYYATLANRLLAINPENPDWQMEAGYAASNLGMLELRDTNNPPKANVHFAVALQHFQIALQAKPGDADIVSNMADGYAWLADSQRALRHYEQARANRFRQRQLLETLLAKDPKNAEFTRDLLGNALGLARIDMSQGRDIEAERRLAATFGDAARQSAVDPDDQGLAREKITIGLFLAEAIIQSGKPDSKQMEPLLAGCRTTAAKADREVTDFCAVVSAQVAAALGLEDATALDYLSRNRARLSTIHHSPRWGIDFSRACLSPSCGMESGTSKGTIAQH
jgi:tetratricopeptide (TPR) repeat protein